MLSLGIALGLSFALVSTGLAVDTVVVSLALTTTALGTLLPMLRDAGITETAVRALRHGRRYGGRVRAHRGGGGAVDRPRPVDHRLAARPVRRGGPGLRPPGGPASAAGHGRSCAGT